jgi:hypothetical protein
MAFEQHIFKNSNVMKLLGFHFQSNILYKISQGSQFRSRFELRTSLT